MMMPSIVPIFTPVSTGWQNYNKQDMMIKISHAMYQARADRHMSGQAMPSRQLLTVPEITPTPTNTATTVATVPIMRTYHTCVPV